MPSGSHVSAAPAAATHAPEKAEEEEHQAHESLLPVHAEQPPDVWQPHALVTSFPRKHVVL